jgi:hypothetical protein
MAKHNYADYSNEKKKFTIPLFVKNRRTNELHESSITIEFECLGYALSSESRVYFNISDELHDFVFSHNEKYWNYPWHKYASVTSEGVECIKEMVEGFMKDWENLIDAPIPFS